MTLDQFSLLTLYSAMTVYTLAFIAFAFDLAHRSSESTQSPRIVRALQRSAQTPSPDLRADSAGPDHSGRHTQTATHRPQTVPHNHTTTTSVMSPPRPPATPTSSRRKTTLRIGVALTIVAFLLHLTADITRGVAAGRVPWANMYEYAMTGTLLIVAVYLVVLLFVDLRFLGTFITGLVLVLLGIATVNFYVSVAPLPPALQSYWLVIHVFVASLSTAFFGLGFALSVLQLLQHRRETKTQSANTKPRLRFLATLPTPEKLESLAYRTNTIGFIFWTFTLIAGAIWAEKAWGRYWGWDTKEVWTFIIWVIYAAYIHARATRGWRGTRSARLAIIGFIAIIFNFTIVNILFKGLHAYSGL